MIGNMSASTCRRCEVMVSPWPITQCTVWKGSTLTSDSSIRTANLVEQCTLPAPLEGSRSVPIPGPRRASLDKYPQRRVSASCARSAVVPSQPPQITNVTTAPYDSSTLAPLPHNEEEAAHHLLCVRAQGPQLV